MSAWGRYDAWLTDYGRCGAPETAPLCHCCEAEVDVIEDGDEDGPLLVVPELCGACEDAGCSPKLGAQCRCRICGAEAWDGLCVDCEAFRGVAQ